MEQSQSMLLETEEVQGQKVLTQNQMELLIHNYGDSLLRLCTLYLRDPYLAEDALQDTYVKVWKYYYNFEGRAAEKTWITRIAINTCKSYLAAPWRRRVDMTEVSRLLEEGIVPEHQDMDAYERLNYTLDLMREIMKLKDQYRLAILLYYYQEMPVPEIAKVMGRRENTIFSLLRRGREQLKKNLPQEIWEVL